MGTDTAFLQGILLKKKVRCKDYHSVKGVRVGRIDIHLLVCAQTCFALILETMTIIVVWGRGIVGTEGQRLTKRIFALSLRSF